MTYYLTSLVLNSRQSSYIEEDIKDELKSCAPTCRLLLDLQSELEFRITMPEGPEIVSITNNLQWLTGKTIIRIGADKDIKGLTHFMLPIKVTKVWCYGKRIVFDITTAEGRNLHLFIFLAMSGIWLVKQGNYTKIEFWIGKYVHLERLTVFDIDQRLFFDDKRNMGKLEVMDEKKLTKKLSEFGVDLFKIPSYEPMYYHFMKLAKNNKEKLYKFINQPKVCASIGNYLRADGIYLADEDPFVEVGQMSPERVAKLCYVLWCLVRESYKKGGYSLVDYVLPDGRKGEYVSCVYGRKKETNLVKSVKDKGNDQTFYYIPRKQ